MAIINVPNLYRLKSQLLTSGLSEKNQPLFQVIDQLIDAIKQGLDQTEAGIATVINNINNINQITFIQSLINEGSEGEDGVGSPGPVGPSGAGGTQGPQGADGPIIFPFDGEDGDYYPPMMGPQGNVGATGPSGQGGVGGLAEDGPEGEPGFFGQLPFQGALAVAQAAQSGAINISTLGTIDWVVPAGVTAPSRQSASSALHSKVTGGWLFQSFDFVVNGGTVFTQNATNGITTTANDDTANAVLAASVAGQGVSKAAGTGEGWRITAPPSPRKSQTLSIYCSGFSAVVTITVTAPFDGLSTSLTFDSGAAAGLDRLITVEYQTQGPINVTALVTTNRGSTPNCKFQAAWIS